MELKLLLLYNEGVVIRLIRRIIMTTAIKVLSIISTVFCGLFAIGSLLFSVVFMFLASETGEMESIFGAFMGALVTILIIIFMVAFIMYLVMLIMGIVAPVRYSKTRTVNSFKAEAIVKIVLGTIMTLFLMLPLFADGAIDAGYVVLLLLIAIVPVMSIIELVLVVNERKNELAASYYNNNQQF